MRRAQLAALGLGRGAIARRVEAGRLLPVAGHRGVFAVGHRARGPLTASWAGHLATGPDSILTHRSGCGLWSLRPHPVRPELTVPGGSRRRRGPLRVHRTSWLPAEHVTRRAGLPVTTLERTLLDLGAVASPREVERAFDQAEVLRLLDMRAIERILRDGAGRPGAAALRAVAGRDAAGSTLTESELEEMLLAIIRGAGLPEPRQQVWIAGFRADFCWPEARLIVEADGARAHAGRRSHVRDTRRDVVLTNAGWTVLRFAYAHIVGDPAYVAGAIRAALARGRLSASM